MNPARAPAPSSPWNPDRVVALGCGVAVVLATLFAYCGTFTVPLVLDDTLAITENYSIRHFSTAWSPPPDTTVTGRPVVNLSLALNYAIGGLGVRGYHALNLAIHLLAALVLFGVVRRTLQNFRVPAATARDATLIAGGVALLWAVHPLQTESVTYTIQRAESLMGLFYLLTLYAFIRGTGCHLLNDNGPAAPAGEKSDCHLIDGNRSSRHSRGWLAVSFGACLLGMATKEVMASAPLLVLLYDRTFVAGTFRAALRRRGGFYAALAATWLVLAALVLSTDHRGGTVGAGTAITVSDYALTQIHAIAHYLRLAFWPAPLVFDHGKTLVTSPVALVLPTALLLALLASTGVTLRTRPMLGFLGVWFFAVLAPSSSVVPIATQTIAEHRMYLPLAAVLALLVLALHRAAGRRVALVLVLAIGTGLAALTQQRNAVYRDPLTLWTETVRAAPDNLRATTNLGLALLQAGRIAEAHHLYAAAVQQRPNLAETHINYANVLMGAHRLDEAAAELVAALRLEPDNLEAHNNLGIALAQSGLMPQALAHFQRAVQLKPASAESHRNLALALAQSGRPAEALAQFAESARLRPLDPLMHDYYGFALFQNGRLPEAVRELETAVHLDPALVQPHHHLGLALGQSGGATEGLAQLEQAARLAPADAVLQNDLGVALASTDRLEAALAHFEQAVKLNPAFAEAEDNRARARAQLIGQ